MLDVIGEEVSCHGGPEARLIVALVGWQMIAPHDGDRALVMARRLGLPVAEVLLRSNGWPRCA